MKVRRQILLRGVGSETVGLNRNKKINVNGGKICITKNF